MFSLPPEFTPYLSYAAPPLVGAFIGYLTNRVAIRMLFRPLKAWKIGRLRVPMTPGVIPSKRHLLAENIGEMVGEHLLTSDEITRALVTERFQSHLKAMIETRVGSYMKHDLGSLESIIPSGYKTYFEIGCKTLLYRCKESVSAQMATQQFQHGVEALLNRWFDAFLERQIDELIPADLRAKLFDYLAGAMSSMFSDPAFTAWLDDLIKTEIRTLARQRKTLGDILPKQVQQLLIESVCKQTPELLDKAAELLKDEDIKDRLVGAVVKAVDEFIETLGPMSAMARNFLSLEMVEEKVRDYLDKRETEIRDFLHDEAVVIRVAAALRERSARFFKTPAAALIDGLSDAQLDSIGVQSAAMITTFLEKAEAAQTLSIFVRSRFEGRIENGSAQTGRVLAQLIGTTELDRIRADLIGEAIGMLKAPSTRQLIDSMIDSLGQRLINHPIGRLDHMIPYGVRDGVCRSLREMTTRMLIAEVPGIVKSIDFKKIVTDRIDSFDLLQVEELLLSIMQEQFKYINLFGALLGFIIGCANVVFLFVLK
jgi:uncharacterized membrane protein YheB (UPF0754 family)